MPKPVIGVIGGPGSGKSSVAAEFAKHGGRVISGDRLGHEALRQPEMRQAMVRHFGPEVVGAAGEIDRLKLGAKVFADPAERRALEALVQPWIERRIREEIAKASADTQVRFIVLDAAIMLEAGWNKVCDVLVYVHAPREVRLRRLAEQRGWTAKEVEARENAQWTLTEKVTRAESALDNSGSLELMARQVEDLLGRWGLAQCPASELPRSSACR